MRRIFIDLVLYHLRNAGEKRIVHQTDIKIAMLSNSSAPLGENIRSNRQTRVFAVAVCPEILSCNIPIRLFIAITFYMAQKYSSRVLVTLFPFFGLAVSKVNTDKHCWCDSPTSRRICDTSQCRGVAVDLTTVGSVCKTSKPLFLEPSTIEQST